MQAATGSATTIRRSPTTTRVTTPRRRGGSTPRFLFVRAGSSSSVRRRADRAGRLRQRPVNGVYRVINDFDGSGTRVGGYAQLRWTAASFTLVPGVRGDRLSLTGETTASPWVQGEWRTSRTTAIRGGAGIYRQFPDFERVIGALGSPDAAAERATQYDLGFEQRLGASMRWQVRSTIRRSRFLPALRADTRLSRARRPRDRSPPGF